MSDNKSRAAVASSAEVSAPTGSLAERGLNELSGANPSNVALSTGEIAPLLNKRTVPDKPFHERGILVTTLQYTMLDQAVGGLKECRLLLETSLPILPRFQEIYAVALKAAPVIREQIGTSDEGNFLLLLAGRVVGCASLDMFGLSDRDFAWLSCVFAEAEGVVLALVNEA